MTKKTYSNCNGYCSIYVLFSPCHVVLRMFRQKCKIHGIEKCNTYTILHICKIRRGKYLNIHLYLMTLIEQTLEKSSVSEPTALLCKN